MANKNTPGSRAEQKASTQARRQARQEKAAREAAALKAKQKARRRGEIGLIIGVVAVVALIVGGVAWALWQSERSSDSGANPANTHDTYAIAFGEEDAETQVVIYEDFLCGYCQDLEELITPSVDAAVDAGTLRIEYRPVAILGNDSEATANAVGVVLDEEGLETAKAFHDALYDPSRATDLSDDGLVELAVSVGADESAVRPGIEDDKFEGWVKRATDEFSQQNYGGTPTVLLNGEVVGGSSIQDVAQQVLAAIQ